MSMTITAGPTGSDRWHPWHKHDAEVAGWPEPLRAAYRAAMRATVNPARMAPLLVGMVTDARHGRTRAVTAAGWCWGKETQAVDQFAAALTEIRPLSRDEVIARGAALLASGHSTAAEVTAALTSRGFRDGTPGLGSPLDRDGYEPRNEGGPIIAAAPPAGMMLVVRDPGDGAVCDRVVAGFNAGGSPVVVDEGGGLRMLWDNERVVDAFVLPLSVPTS